MLEVKNSLISLEETHSFLDTMLHFVCDTVVTAKERPGVHRNHSFKFLVSQLSQLDA